MIASFIFIFDAISDIIILQNGNKNSWINIKIPRIYCVQLFALYDNNYLFS